MNLEVLDKIRSRGWIFTIPRIYNDEVITIKDIVSKLSKYKYFVLQVEKGEETGYMHYQLYLEHTNPIKKSTLVNLFPFAHMEERKGSMKQAYDYVTKEETRLHGPFEFGDRPSFNEKNTSSGLRAQFIDDVADGMDDFNLLMKYPTIYTKRLVDEYRAVLGIKDPYLLKNRDVQVFYISGPAGSGKSSFIRRLFDVEDIYVVSDYEKDPFGSYAGQDVLVFEEYRSDFQLSVFLQYLDRYPIMLPARYNNKVAKFTKVFIISNWKFTDQYTSFPLSDKKAFWRRLKYVFTIHKDFINRYVITPDFGVKECGNTYNPIGEYGEYFPEFTDFNNFLEIGFD